MATFPEYHVSYVVIMIETRGLWTDRLVFNLQLRETSGIRAYKDLRSVIASNRVPYLQMTLVKLHSMSDAAKKNPFKLRVSQDLIKMVYVTKAQCKLRL